MKKTQKNSTIVDNIIFFVLVLAREDIVSRKHFSKRIWNAFETNGRNLELKEKMVEVVRKYHFQFSTKQSGYFVVLIKSSNGLLCGSVKIVQNRE